MAKKHKKRWYRGAALRYGIWFVVSLAIVFGLGREFNEDTWKTQTTFTSDGITKFRKGMDVAGWVRLTYKVDFSKYDQLYTTLAERDQAKTDAIQVILKNIDNRISALWVSDYSARQQLIGNDIFLVVEIGGVHSIDNAKEIIGKTVELEFKIPLEDSNEDLESLKSKQTQLASNLFADIKERPDLMQELASSKQGQDIYFSQLTGVDVDTLGNLYKNHKQAILDAQSGDIIEVEWEYLSSDQSWWEAIQAYSLLLVSDVRPSTQEDLSLEKLWGIAGQFWKEFWIATGQVHESNPGSVVYDEAQQSVLFNSNIPASSFGGPKTWQQVLGIFGVSTQESEQILDALQNSIVVDGMEVLVLKTPQWVPAIDQKSNEVLNGAYFAYAAPGVSQFGKPVVTINFNDKWKEMFCNLSKQQVGKQMAIFVGWELQTNPVINEAICGGSAQIDGDFDTAWAKELSDSLNEWALPAPLILSSEEKVSPTLGEGAINGAFLAAGIGILLMVVFLLIFYGWTPALVGISVIVAFLVYSLALFKLIDYAFSLSWIAAVILSLAMSIDANIIMYERLTEELKTNKSRLSAVDDAYERSWLAIRDGNVTNLIVYVVLFGIGMSVFKWFGFAGLITGLLVLLVNVPLMKILLKLFRRR